MNVNNNYNGELNIGIIGIGELGANIYREIVCREQSIHNKIANVRLFGSTDRKPERLIQTVQMSGYKSAFKTCAHPYSELSDFLSELNIVFVAASASQTADLQQDTRVNMALIDCFAKQFRPDYKGLVVIATTPTDALCYEFSRLSDMNPLRIIGLNGLEHSYASTALGEVIGVNSDDDSNIYVVGPQGNTIILSSSTINKEPLERLVNSNTTFALEQRRAIIAKQMSADKDSLTRAAAAKAVNILQAISSGGVETVSTIYNHIGKGLYISLPVEFHDLQPLVYDPKNKQKQVFKECKSLQEAQSKNSLIANITSKEKSTIDLAVEQQILFMKNMGIWNGGIKPEAIHYEPVAKKLTPKEQEEEQYELVITVDRMELMRRMRTKISEACKHYYRMHFKGKYEREFEREFEKTRRYVETLRSLDNPQPYPPIKYVRKKRKVQKPEKDNRTLNEIIASAEHYCR